MTTTWTIAIDWDRDGEFTGDLIFHWRPETLNTDSREMRKLLESARKMFYRL